MRLTGRRTSSNIQDRRGMSGKAIGIGGGIIGVIIAAVVTFLSGGNMGDVARVAFNSMQDNGNTTQTRQLDAEDQRLYDLASKVLAGTEDVWTKKFQEEGWGEYTPPQMVIYSGSIQTGCGQGTAQVGPFYCSADQTVYIDLDFFKTMQQDIGASGDFTYAYVIAHEVGHHVQNLLGTLGKAHSAMAQTSEAEANKISVCLELQADCYAGIWGYADNEMFGSIEPGDIENAINAASKIGDDYLQKKAYGREMPESFNHGRSEWRVYWLSKGLKSGDPDVADTFTGQYPPR
ncbi:MAG: neutral zinc metallopeptidase [Bacteroidales bacterium]|nr:neutral zinc metallopeptidase [Bacteroidales bacterium]